VALLHRRRANERDPAPSQPPCGRADAARPRSAAGRRADLTSYVRQATSQPRFTATLSGAFAGLATLLAGLGIYGVLAYGVAQRRREIGIRMALGAQRATCGRCRLAGARPRRGRLGAGLAGALALTRVLASLLFGVSASDPLTFAAVCALLMAVVASAAYLPARRATHVESDRGLEGGLTHAHFFTQRREVVSPRVGRTTSSPLNVASRRRFVSIMGPSGAGKSTLLHILGMHDSAWSGEYYFMDQPVIVSIQTAFGTARSTSGRLPELSPARQLTVYENLRFRSRIAT